MLDPRLPKSVIVGIDGSTAALRAALWAADRVAGTDTLVRLLYIKSEHLVTSPLDVDTTRAAAEAAVYEARSAIDTIEKPVKVDVEIRPGQPVPALIRASNEAALLCVGGTGSAHPGGDGFGCTAAELVQSAHCSVAVVRDHHVSAPTEGRCIVAWVDEPPNDSKVLQTAFEEAQRRNAPLVVMTAWRSGFDDLQDDRAIDENDQLARSLLDHHLARWMPHYPVVEVRADAAYGTFLNYLTEHAQSIQLFIVGAEHARELQQLVGPAGALALRRSDFSLLVVR